MQENMSWFAVATMHAVTCFHPIRYSLCKRGDF